MTPSPIHATFAMSPLPRCGLDYVRASSALGDLCQESSGHRMRGSDAAATPGSVRMSRCASAIVEARQGGGQTPMGNAPHGMAAARADVTFADIERAAGVLAGAVLETDCHWSRTLSDMLGCELWLKFENLQFTASFKERGALNRLAALAPGERAAGVIAMSAGN